MDDGRIKSAIKSQLDSIELNQQLKEKTIQSIKQQSDQSHFRTNYFLGGGISLVMICLVAIVLINPFKQLEQSPKPIAALEEGSSVQLRGIKTPFEQLKQLFNQLNLTYEIQSIQIESDYQVTPIEMEQDKSYYVELSTMMNPDDFCVDSSYLVIQLDEKNFFFYTGSNEDVIKTLTHTGKIICK